MKVVCIKNFKSQGLQYELTKDKIYNVESKPKWASKDTFFIKNDRGFISAYSDKSFITLEDYRLMKLKDLGI